MPTLKERIDSLAQDTLTAANSYVASIGTKRARETSLHHVTEDSGVHIRDDGAVEIFAGQARLVLAPDGTIYLTGSLVVLEGEEVHILTKSKKLTVNGAEMNPELYTKTKSDDLLTTQADYTTVQLPQTEVWENMPLVVGAPAGAEQTNLSMSDYWKPRRLFQDAQSTNLKSKLEQLINGN